MIYKNTAEIIGHLGGDVELNKTKNGTSVVSLSVATNEFFKDKSGNVQQSTEWHRVVLWKKLAETASEYLKKGSKVLVAGRLRTREWQDKNGVKRYTTEIHGHTLKFDSDPNGDSSAAPEQDEAPLPEPEYVEDE